MYEMLKWEMLLGEQWHPSVAESLWDAVQLLGTSKWVV